MKKALLIFNMVNYFFDDFPISTKNQHEIIEPIKELLYEFRAHEDLVVFINSQEIKKDNKIIQLLPLENRPDGQIVKKLTPRATETIIYKKKYSGFAGTNLTEVLEKNNIEKLVLAGIYSDFGIFYTMIDAIKSNYKIKVYSNCTASSIFNDNRGLMKWMELFYKAEVVY